MHIVAVFYYSTLNRCPVVIHEAMQEPKLKSHRDRHQLHRLNIYIYNYNNKMSKLKSKKVDDCLKTCGWKDVCKSLRISCLFN